MTASQDAKTARETLAKGLALLQQGELPPEFLDAAGTVAQAMGALMLAERAGENYATFSASIQQALVALREAMARMQALPIEHPVAEQVMAVVAQGLGMVHPLSQLPPSAFVPQAAPIAPMPYIAPMQAPAAFAPMVAPSPVGFAPAAVAPTAFAAPAPIAPPMQAPAPYVPPAAPAPNPAPALGYGQGPANPYYQQQPPMQQQAYPQPVAPMFPQPAAPTVDPFSGAPSQSSPPASIPPPAGGFEAELGTNSTSNFYKTLNGNDIVEHGGIFVASYKLPPLGREVDIRVHFPGGYQFDCRGVVRWVRDSVDNDDVPPGFGAQLVNVNGEQRHLIQRYVRNREPMFYDDF